MDMRRLCLREEARSPVGNASAWRWIALWWRTSRYPLADEATSSLDVTTERVVNKILNRLSCTQIIIAIVSARSAMPISSWP